MLRYCVVRTHFGVIVGRELAIVTPIVAIASAQESNQEVTNGFRDACYGNMLRQAVSFAIAASVLLVCCDVADLNLGTHSKNII